MPLPPRPPLSKLEQIRSLLAQGKGEQARVLVLRLAQSAPEQPEVNALAAEVLRSIGELRPALFYIERAPTLSDEAGLHAQRAMILFGLQEFEPALAAARRAVEVAPGEVRHRALLAKLLFARARVGEAIDAAMIGGEIPVSDPALVITAAYALPQLGRHGEAQSLFARAAAAHPGDIALASARCNASLYAPALSREEVFDIHRRFGQIVADVHGPGRPPLLRDPNPARRLRVGILSPDLRRHSVAFFIAPFFEHHDRAQVDLVVFDTSSPGQADDMTRRLRTHASAWRRVAPGTLMEFADAIRAERIDILIELSGHTGGNALEIMPYGPAPVLISYLGYPCTTGLACMDYRIVDSITDPSPSADPFSTERLIRLDPCFLCYSPPFDAPPVAAPDPTRPVTFGSFNNASKLNDALMALWARVLAAVPSSRIVLKAIGLTDPQARERLTSILSRHGVAPGRVSFGTHSATVGEHLARYADIDIALDSYPYHGTTTTCDSLLMGVPVVTLMGDRHLSRVGGSLLHAAGLPECIAHSEDEYVEIAAGLAADRARLTKQRATLRARLLGSTLCDGAAFARRCEAALRSVWRNRCEAPRPGPTPSSSTL